MLITPLAAPRGLIVFALLACAFSGGCSTDREWVAAPTLVVQAGAAAFDATPLANRTPEIEVIYVTDRNLETDKDRGITYGHGRTDTITFGIAKVGFKPAMTWDELVAESVNPNRERTYNLHLTDINKAGEFMPIAKRMEIAGDRYAISPEAAKGIEAEDAQLAALIAQRLERTQTKDVYVSVHGVDNAFDDAIYRTAEVWHYGGRNGVALAYTWPAGYPGLIGYVYDRESAEYTVSHFKRVLRVLAKCKEAQRVHIIAHSRGSEVSIAALRELHIEARAKGVDTGKWLKLDTLVFAAPDIDWDIFRQRFTGEMVMNVPARLVIYFSEKDDALNIVEWLFGSFRRLGNLVAEDNFGPRKEQDYGPPDPRDFAKFSRVEFINCDVSGYCSTHDYVFAHPAVLSDLILVVRDRKPAGSANGRPLTPPAEGLWRIDNEYLKPAPAR